MRKQNRKTKPTRDLSLKCTICGQNGHDTNSEKECMIFAKWALCKRASEKLNASDTKTNTRKYL